jgi:hypothetical protein
MSEKFKQTTNALVKKLNIKEAEMVVDLLG